MATGVVSIATYLHDIPLFPKVLFWLNALFLAGALHRVRERMVSQRTGIINQIRAFLLERGVAVRQGLRFLRAELPGILATQTDVLSPHLRILGLGLVPKQMSTGDRTILGSISKRGNRYLRSPFVQAAWVVLVKFGPKHWERYGLKSWIEAARKRLHHNVLAIALANKLARIAWAVLHKGRAFECVKTDAMASRPT